MRSAPAVCPNCSARAPLVGPSAGSRCRGCSRRSRSGRATVSGRCSIAGRAVRQLNPGPPMMDLRWARLNTEGPYPLRRGAWYRISRLSPDEVVLDVSRRTVTVPRSMIDLVETLPRRWTIVPRPTNAVQLPASWGEWYVVCPSCRHRAPLHGARRPMRCPRCRGVFAVARDERYWHGNPTGKNAPEHPPPC